MTPQPPAPNPYAPPLTTAHADYAPPAPGYGVPPPRIEGSAVTIAKGYALPPLCAKCGTMADLRTRTQTFSWFPRWTYFLLFLGLLPMIILQMDKTKRAVLALPMCPRCDSRWKTGRVLRTLSIVVPVFGGLALAIAGAANDILPLMGAGFLLVFPGVLAVIPVDLLVQRPRILWATFIDDYWVTLKGFAPEMLEVLRRG
jgi:hypothetical protein